MVGKRKPQVHVLKKRRKKYKIAYEQELNPAQYEVVRTTENTCIVIAGAGSGKTRTLVYRVAWLIENGVSPDQIMLVTFTNKAAREMLNRVERLLGQQPKGLWGGTFHHIGNLLLRKYGALIQVDNNFSILDEGDSAEVFKKCAVPVKGELRDIRKLRRFPTARQLNDIYKTHVDCNQPVNDVLAEKYPAYSDDLESIERVIKLYKKEKKERNLLDFTDLLTKWLELLRNKKIGMNICKKFKHILVDEYQDVNRIQASIVEEIAKYQSNVMVVGDDAQSIYSFRGADVKNLLEFPKKFKNCKIFYLEQNYRSTPEILSFTNECIKHNVHQFKKKLWTERDSGMKVTVCSSDDIDDQNWFLIDKILEFRGMDILLSEMAVLYRAMYHSNELQLALNESNIPYIVRGGLRFFEKRHIKDVISFLRIINNSKDELAWIRSLQLIEGIGDKSATKIYGVINTLEDPLHEIKETSFSNKLRGLRINMKAWNAFTQLIIYILNKNLVRAPEIIDAFLKLFYQKYLERVFPNYEERIIEIDQLAIYSQDFVSLEEFISHCIIDVNIQGSTIQVGKTDSDEEKLILSTVHQAKGLEWRVVFIINASQGGFPITRVFGDSQRMEEERRLFYVACTRSKDYLYIIHPIFTQRYSGTEFSQPSQFIEEIEKNFYEGLEIRHAEVEE